MTKVREECCYICRILGGRLVIRTVPHDFGGSLSRRERPSSGIFHRAVKEVRLHLGCLTGGETVPRSSLYAACPCGCGATLLSVDVGEVRERMDLR